MDAIVFTWSGSLQEEWDDRADDLAAFLETVHDRYGMEAGILSEADRAATEDAVGTDLFDFAVGNVENIVEVMTALAGKYDKVFFVSDLRAELAAVNQSGAYTVGYNAESVNAEELSGVGPNYIVDSLDELEQILLLEEME